MVIVINYISWSLAIVIKYSDINYSIIVVNIIDEIAKLSIKAVRLIQGLIFAA